MGGEIKVIAKKKLSGNWEVAILTLAMVTMAEIVVSIFTLGAGVIVAFGPLSLGKIFVYDSIVKGDEADWKRIIDPFKDRFADSFIVGLINGLILTAPILLLVFSILATGASLLTIGIGRSMGVGLGAVAGIGLMFILIAFIFAAFLVLLYVYAEGTYILLREKDIKGFAALKKSRLMMKGKKMKLFLFDLSFIGWWILFVIIPLVGLYVIPYFTCARLLMLESIYNESEGLHSNTVNELVQTPKIKKETESKKSKKTNSAKKSNEDSDEQSSTNSAKRFCKHCGAELPEGAMFCGKCGKAQEGN